MTEWGESQFLSFMTHYDLNHLVLYDPRGGRGWEGLKQRRYKGERECRECKTKIKTNRNGFNISFLPREIREDYFFDAGRKR